MGKGIYKIFFLSAVILVACVMLFPEIVNSDSSGPNSPATTADDSGTGTATWSDTGNITTSNDTRATVSIDSSNSSHYLKATNFGFSIPAGATINGIVVEWEKGGGGGFDTDNAVRIVKGGTIGSTDKSSLTAWPSSDTYASYGSSSDVWGETWTADDINATTFGAAISVKTTAALAGPTIDHVRITIHYTTGITIGGTVYTDEGTTNIGANKTVAVSVNGAAAAGTDDTDASGVFSITGITVSAGDVLTLYLDGETEKAVTVTVGTGSNMTGINLYQNYLITRHDNSGSLTNTNINTADGNGDTDITDIISSASNTALTVAAGKSLFIPSSHTFAPGGTVSVGGNFSNNGTFTHGSSTLTLTGTSASQTLKTNSSSLYNLVINGSGGTYTLQDALTTANNLTITAGTLDTKASSNYGVSVGGTWSRSGTFAVRSAILTLTGTSTFSDTMSFYDLTINGSGITVTLGANLTATSTLTLTQGTLDANGNNVTAAAFSSSNSNTRAITMGTGTWTLSGTGTVWTTATATNLTVTANTSTLVISDTSSTSKTFAGGGKTYYNISITASGSGAVIFTGANTFNNFTINNPKTITFPASTTTTITGTFSCSGSSGNVITINSSTSDTAATLSKANGTVTCNYLSLRDSTATGGAVWRAGSNSTNVSGNTGWVFGTTAPPAPSGFNPATGSTIKTATPNITFVLDEDGDCKASTTNASYSAMSGADCTGDGSSAGACLMSTLGSNGSKTIYFACQDSDGNQDTADTTHSVTYTLTASDGTVNPTMSIKGSGKFTGSGVFK